MNKIIIVVGTLVFGICNVQASGSAECLAQPPDLLSWWPGDGHANDIHDGNDGTLQNGASFSSGIIADTFILDGIDDHVLIPHSSNLDIEPGTSLTIETWAFRTSPASPMHLVGKRDGCGSIAYQLAIGGGAVPPNAVPLNVWTHLAVTTDGNTGGHLHYVNGTVVLSSNFTIGQNTAPLKIGNSGSCQPFGGLIDEVSIYTRVLDASEIQAIFEAGSDGKCKFSIEKPEIRVENGYFNFSALNGASPEPLDCEYKDDYGRAIFDEINSILYICGPNGWISK